MATSSGAAITRHVRSMLEAGPIRDLSDGQLLDLFDEGRADRRELAFAALVERHGLMVRAVARGVLGSRSDADDAFQATFLVLARKAADLTGRDTVGPWLFQVARRTALASRRAEARRRRLDQTVDRPSASRVPDPEAVAIVHEEVARLPDRDRAVVVLCDLEGESLDQAARMLGCPVGTVKSRLSRARDRLGRGLRRRGLDGSQLIPLGMAPALPITFVDLATTAAIRFAAWSPLATSVAHLARGVIRTMSIKQGFASATTCLGVAMVIVVGSAWLRAGEPVPQDPRSVAKIESPVSEKPVIETAIVRPDLANRVITEEATIDTFAGVGVFVDAPFPTKVKGQLVPFGRRVKKDDVLFELDTARIEATLRQIDERWELIKSSKNRGQGNNPSVKAETAEGPENRSASPHPQIAAAQNTLNRAEAKTKRYREATTNSNALAISPSDPAMLPAIAARLSLIDRLDEAEVDLDRRRKNWKRPGRCIPTRPWHRGKTPWVPFVRMTERRFPGRSRNPGNITKRRWRGSPCDHRPMESWHLPRDSKNR